jgi:RNA polymerase sigma-70 factor (ECF subfamily)
MAMSSTAARPAERCAPDDVCVRIFEADFDYVYRSLIRMGVTAADAEDLAQEVFLVMWRRRADWDADRPLRSWLFGVALRVAHEHRHRRRREAPVGIADQTDERPPADDLIAANRARALVIKAIATLPEKQRAVLILHEIEGTPMREVADALSVPLFTAYTRLRAARKSFARAVRRIELTGRGLPSPDVEAALLNDERNRVVPYATRERVMERVRALVPTLPHVRAPAAWPAAWALKGLALAAASALAVVGVGRLAGPRPRAVAHARTVRGPAGPQPRSTAMASLASGRSALSGEGLLGYWRFDDRRGSRIARDLSGMGNDCVLRRLDPNQASVEGVAGRALRFDGRGHLECGAPETVDKLSSAVTMAGWMKLDKRDPDLRAVMAWQRGHGLARFGLFFGLTGSKLLLASDVWGRIEWPLQDTVGRWIHVAATRDPNGWTRLYVDGAEVAHHKGSSQPLGAGSNPLTVGGHINPADPHKITQRIHGALDELVLFDRALSSSEIAALASDEAPALLEQQLLSR